MTTPQRKMPPPPPSRQAATLKFEQVLDSAYGHRALLYGPGGIGKTSLGCLAGKVAFVDADESLEKLKSQLSANGTQIPVKVPARDWLSLRSAVQQVEGFKGIDTIILDTWEPIEKWCTDYTLANIKIDGKPAESIEEYGWGKGYRYVFETFGQLLGDLDAHVRVGRNVIIICHDETCKVPNPGGQDFIRWEPKMQHTDKASIKHRVKGWADHVLFLTYDMNVKKQAGDKLGVKLGKAEGHGTRTMYTSERPHFMAKSRTTADNFDIELGTNPWPNIFK